MPTVDIIIPAYNAARYLRAAIESVLAQTYVDWRIILVNDGSTDETAEIAEEFKERLENRMLVITQANGGMSAARNRAIRESSGEFLAFLDADDIWLPCRLAESMKSFRSRPEVGLSYGLITRIDEQGNLLETFAGNRTDAEGKIARAIYMRKVELPCVTITLRRECVEEAGCFDETMKGTEDRDLWLRIALRHEIAFVPRVLAYYRVSANSVSTDLNRMLAAQRQFIRKHYGASGCGPVARQIALSRAYKQRGEIFYQRQKRGRALLSSLQALAIWPMSTDNLRTTGSLAFHLVFDRHRG